jgi:uncharacterized protein (TIRG00374 family)
MRRFLFAIVILFAIFVIITRVAEVENVIDTFRRADLRFLVIAFGIQLLWNVNLASSFWSIYNLLGLREGMLRLIGLVSAASFVNGVTPSMGMGGMTILIADGQRRNHRAGRVTTSAAVFILYEYTAVLMILSVGLWILFRRNQLTPGEIIASGILLFMAMGLATVLFLGMRSERQLAKLLERLGGLVNRIARPFIRRDYLDLSRARTFAADIANGLAEARRSRRGLLLPLGFALSSKILMIGVLLLTFMAFGEPYSAETLIAGFSIGYLFTIVAITPYGIGFAEGALALTLNSMRVPLATAAVIALAYRGVTYWLQLVYGLIAFRWFNRQPASLPASAPEVAPLSPQQSKAPPKG